MRLLLAAGADVNAKTQTSMSRTALDVAREYGYAECAHWLNAFACEDLVEIERVKREYPLTDANYITLPTHAMLQARSPSAVRA